MPFWSRTFNVFRRTRVDRHIDDELQSHIAEAIADGRDPAEARSALGSMIRHREASHDLKVAAWLEQGIQDVFYAIRTLRRSPGFLSCAVLTLGLGIGANATIFSVVNGILLRPPPFRDPARLVMVLDSRPSQGIDWVFDSPSRYEEWVRRNTVFEEIAAGQNCYYRLDGSGGPQLLQGGCASASFLPMLGVQPILGRLFSDEEDRPGAPGVAVLSYGCWKDHFGGSPDVLGKTVRRTANDAEFTIIGVLPATFRFATDDFALWAPLRSDPNYRQRDDRNLLVFARLKQGVTLSQAQAVMDGVAVQLAREFPTSTGWSITVRPLQVFYSSVRNIRLTLWVLFVSVGLLLLIACANVANLLLTRTGVRSREISVRLALGASSGRIVRQLVTESLVLGGLGGATGFLLARLCLPLLMTITPYIPSFRPDAIRVDDQVLVFSMLFALLSALVFGLAPALRASRQDLNQNLRESGRGLQGGRRDRIVRSLVVASEIALAVVLVAGAGLLAESFRTLTTEPLGFDPSHIVTARLCCLDETQYPNAKDTVPIYVRLFDRLRTIPGVESVSGASDLPLRQFQSAGASYEVRGKPIVAGQEQRAADFFRIEPHYFETLRIPIVRGRAIADADTMDTVPVAVVNESLARRIWPGQDPIGQELRMLADDLDARWYRIVGVVADSRARGLGIAPYPAIYASYFQGVGRYAFLLVRSRPGLTSVVPDIRRAVASVNDRALLDWVGSLEQRMTDSVSAQRFSTVLALLFAVLALMLGAVGVYGVTACTIAQRTQEIGIRVALGASRVAVIGMFLRETTWLAVFGLGAGALAAVGLTQFLRSLLYGVRANDPRVLAGAVVFLALVTVGAVLAPALRATRVDPVTALRCD